MNVEPLSASEAVVVKRGYEEKETADSLVEKSDQLYVRHIILRATKTFGMKTFIASLTST
jgi:hypothetical protein